MDNFDGTTTTNVECLVMSEGATTIEKRMQILEMENGRLMKCQGQIIKETNRKLELYTNENKFLQYAFNKLKKQNEELRELCYFLDDDRKESKRMYNQMVQQRQTNEYESAKQVISDQEDKIKHLEEREQMLTEDNRRLKLMCDSWIEFAMKNSADVSRDCGDGSSDSESFCQKQKDQPISTTTNAKAKDDLQHPRSGAVVHNYENINIFDIKDINCHHENKSCERNLPSVLTNYSYDDLLGYIKSLETRVQQLEKERSTSTSASTSLQAIVASEEHENLTKSTPDGAKECNDSEEILNVQLQDGTIWTEERFDDESSLYISRLRNHDFYAIGEDDNDNNNIILSPIAEETETEEEDSCTSSTSDDFVERRNYTAKIMAMNLHCDQTNGNDSLKMISRKNIKTTTNWNVDDQNSNNRPKLLLEEKNYKCSKKVSSTNSVVDSFAPQHNLLDLFSNNLQSTTI